MLKQTLRNYYNFVIKQREAIKEIIARYGATNDLLNELHECELEIADGKRLGYV